MRFFPRTGSRCKQLNDIKPLHPLIQEIAQGSFRQKQPPAIQGSGWVVKSLEASLWAFHDADTFEEAVLRAVNLGDDADTTGAICGQLAGAYWGESSIPRIVAVGSGTNGHAGERSGGDSRSVIELNPSRTLRVYNKSSLLVPKRSSPCSPSPESVLAIPSATSP